MILAAWLSCVNNVIGDNNKTVDKLQWLLYLTLDP